MLPYAGRNRQDRCPGALQKAKVSTLCALNIPAAHRKVGRARQEKNHSNIGLEGTPWVIESSPLISQATPSYNSIHIFIKDLQEAV